MEGGQARDILCLLSPMPTHQEPVATPIMAVGRSPPGSPCLRAPGSRLPGRSGTLGWGAGRGRARGLGNRRAGDPAGGGIEGRALGGPLPPPAPPRLPTKSVNLEGEGWRCTPALCRLGAWLLPVEFGGAPFRGHLSSPSETSRPATHVSDRRPWDPGTGCQARRW